MASRRATQPTILPHALKQFGRNRLIEATGLLLLAATIFILLSIVSFNPDDPSLSHATDGRVRNLGGQTGANVADLLLQWLGLTSLVLAGILTCWGTRLFAKRTLPRFGRRLVLLPLLLVTAAVLITAIGAQPPGAWPIPGGGAVGLLSFGPLAENMPSFAVVLLAGLIGATLFFYVSAIPAESWFNAAQVTLFGARDSARLTGQVASKGAEVTRRGLAAIAARRAMRQEPRLTAAPRNEPAQRAAAPRPPEAAPERRRDLVAVPDSKLREGRRATAARQTKLNLHEPTGEYTLPPLDLLNDAKPEKKRSQRVNEEALEENARLLEAVLEDFGVRGEIVKVRPGPVVTLYELEPAPGTKTSRVISLADDVARSMSAVSVRIAVVPGRNVIGIELPNARREIVLLRELLASAEFEEARGALTLTLGRDIGGAPNMVDLARMPHLLIAGTTGSGKSVGVNSMILSLLYRLPPDRCKFIMIDPKMLELSVYDGIPHLLAPVVTNPKKAVVALKWVVREMEERYRSMSKLGVRNIAGYNQRIEQARKRGEVLTRRVQTGFDPDTGKPVHEDQPLESVPLPYIVVIVDEMADLMLVAGKEVEAAIQRLAQMARAAGIHLIMATQRPSVDVVTGTIKANFPNRISFQVTTKIDSRTILGEQGGEQLLGMGDMLHMAGGGRITRVHGPFVSDAEVEDIVAYLKQQGEPEYIDDVTEDEDIAAGIPGFETSGGDGESADTLYDQAVALVARERKASTSFVQRHLQIGYNRAARIIEQMEKEGVVSTANHVGKREVLVNEV